MRCLRGGLNVGNDRSVGFFIRRDILFWNEKEISNMKDSR